MLSSVFCAADSSASLNRLYHGSGLVLAGLVPLAFISPSTITMPMDIAASILIPFHSHVGLNYVVSDYVPQARRPLARALVLAATIVATAGLLKLTFHGPGVTHTIKSLWEEKKPKAKKAKENQH